jgi:putative ABC transport system permease protein
LTAELDYSVSGFTTWVRPTGTRPQVSLKALIERLRQIPGVQAVGAGSRLIRRENRPPGDPVAIQGQPPLPPEQQPTAEFKGVSPDWIHALGARLLRGRDFTEADQLEAPGAVLVNESFARRHFADADPIGQRLRMGSGQPPSTATNVWGLPEWSEIVGVVSDVKSLHPQPEAAPEVYVSYWQYPMQAPTILLRATGNPAALTDVIRRETKTLIPNLPSPLIRTMDDLISDTVAQPRFQTGLLAAFAGMALLLAAIGLYGVLAYSIAQREREIGVRLTLGAQRHQVLGLVIGRGMRLVLAGLVVGLIASVALTRVMRSLLYGVTPTDPLTVVLAAAVMLGATLLACWLPARKAARTDPVVALRAE